MRVTWTDRVAVVTGAGSGIGRQLAYALGRRGCRLAISDIDEAGLEQTRSGLVGSGVETFCTRLDVADRAAVESHAAEVHDHFGAVHQLYNNAGVGTGRRLREMSYDDLDRILSINLWGVIHGTKAFLPHLISSGDGYLINISSVNAFLAQPGLSAYCASKFAVRGFTEAVRAEMIADRLPVKVVVVHPGGVRTNIATAALAHARAAGHRVTAEDEHGTAFYNDKLLRADPGSVAEGIVTAVGRGRSRVIVGTHAHKIDVLTRLAPALAPRAAALVQRALSRADPPHRPDSPES